MDGSAGSNWKVKGWKEDEKRIERGEKRERWEGRERGDMKDWREEGKEWQMVYSAVNEKRMVRW